MHHNHFNLFCLRSLRICSRKGFANGTSHPYSGPFEKKLAPPEPSRSGCRLDWRVDGFTPPLQEEHHETPEPCRASRRRRSSRPVDVGRCSTAPISVLDGLPANKWYYYPYMYFPHNYWPAQAPRWPESPGMPYMKPPAYQAYPPFQEQNWRYEMWQPQRYYRGNHFWLDQF